MTTSFEVPGKPPPDGRVASGHFHTTRWTQVIQAKESSHEGRDALRDLCAAYYSPVLAFLRRQGRESDAAQELAHEFFAYILQGEAIRTADQIKGRFRSYLLGSVKHFLSRRQEHEQRLRRGGGLKSVSIHAGTDTEPDLSLADDGQLSPDAAFDRQWALTVLDRALARLTAECANEGKSNIFEKLQPWLTGESEHGDQVELAASLEMNLNSLKSVIHRLKQRFRILVREEVAATLEEGAEVEAEIRVLFTALRNR